MQRVDYFVGLGLCVEGFLRSGLLQGLHLLQHLPYRFVGLSIESTSACRNAKLTRVVLQCALGRSCDRSLSKRRAIELTALNAVGRTWPRRASEEAAEDLATFSASCTQQEKL
jgi:hypothetical protein